MKSRPDRWERGELGTGVLAVSAGAAGDGSVMREGRAADPLRVQVRVYLRKPLER
jgi:hypothetical protein